MEGQVIWIDCADEEQVPRNYKKYKQQTKPPTPSAAQLMSPIKDPEPGSESGPKHKLKTLKLKKRLKKRKLEHEEHSLQDQIKERSENHLTLSQKDKKPYECGKCGAKFLEQNILYHHIYTNLH